MSVIKRIKDILGNATPMQDINFIDKLDSKIVLVTGGTGSFGTQIIGQLLKSNVKEIRIFSRGEDLQHQMAVAYHDPRLNFIIGDVRDYERVQEATRNVDYVFHAAALKQVPDCETHPFEAVKTNIIGAHNVKISAFSQNVKMLIFISTDKAVKPVNAMGMSKALQEKVMLTPELRGNTAVCGVRYGKVVGSRGRVVPLFAERKKRGEPLIVTDPNMTRFWLTLTDAIHLVFKALVDGKPTELLVLKRPACRIVDLAEVMADGKVPVELGQIRAGEKIHETLVQEEEMRHCIEEDEYFRILPHESGGFSNIKNSYTEYTSANTHLMTKKEIELLLRDEGWL